MIDCRPPRPPRGARKTKEATKKKKALDGTGKHWYIADNMNKGRPNGRRFKVVPAYTRGEPDTIFEIGFQLSSRPVRLEMVRD